MDAGVTSSLRSILDKPLNKLTEEDISQLTREDCRKFLKEKGMRRPSWNKAQAIQQVISLKTLLESSGDSGAGALRRALASPPPPPPPPQQQQQQNADPLTPDSVASEPSDSVKEVKEPSLEDDAGPYRRKDPPISAPIGCCAGEPDSKTVSPRSPGETFELGGQMTIFYCGKVNVYDGVPPEKARTIMHLAASHNDLCQDNTFSGNGGHRSSMFHLPATDKHGLTPSTALNSHTFQTDKLAEYQQRFRGSMTHELDVDGQVNRKVSLQRYLEKRKDRFFKGRKNTGQTTSTLGICLNHQVRMHNSNGPSSRSSTSSPPQPRLPHAFCTSEDQSKVANLSVNLNDEGIQEC